ncbi:hypothetical protein [Ruminococcus sp.]|nr:hypothetical protein [Ruminococcus sp.]
MKNILYCCFAAVCIKGDGSAGKTTDMPVRAGAPCGLSNDSDGY